MALVNITVGNCRQLLLSARGVAVNIYIFFAVKFVPFLLIDPPTYFMSQVWQLLSGHCI